MASVPGWNPRVYLWDGGWIGIGRAHAVVPPHKHHAIQICIALEGQVRVRQPDEEWREYEGVIVRPDEEHTYNGNGALAAMLFVDPETHEGRWLLDSVLEPISGVQPSRLERATATIRRIMEDPPRGEELAELIASVVQDLCAGPPPLQKLDERIVKALEIIQQSEGATVSLESVAKAVFLSPSRFAHLFADQVGLPLRRYVLWRKLNRAMTMVRRGSTLSAAAHRSGFSDSAHLTRTFYQMFGTAPSLMMPKGSQVYEIPAPFSHPAAGVRTATPIGSD